ncbi:acyltransferase family protein [Hyphomicrobium facile]|uniref:Peptidoglycan/LPS O-acetylase OafA/YrhL, contains acyltransferase and SGNH-hydrolase domains n=1 Tax=Hyphomicrobium facile TaxID=51670 RepID=A0A1I7NPT1_9HYPH|nr:acyltransferase [Hyphomicrobium facile]SFV36684.1 Peptidoglycan/LPS O-acetylase OafA/YrhL, contains acyltransferase and SGNH-hydrolase domains [Hyphomicrobium facile]
MGERLPTLDGLRAVAILLVLASHLPYTESFPPSSSTDFLTSHGQFGVRLFFVISGFLITHLLLKEHGRFGSVSLSEFYIRRSFRILPIYVAFLLTIAGFQFFGLVHDQASSWLGSLTFTRNVLGRGDSPSIHLWSLAVEEQFYLLWPSAIAFLGLADRPRRALAILCGTILVAVIARSVSCQTGIVCVRLLGEKSLIHNGDSLAVGCALVFWMRSRQPASRLGLLSLGSTSLVLFASCFITPTNAWSASLLILAQTLGFAALIYCGVAQSRSGIAFQFLNSKAMTAIGLISYSLYVWHMLFLSANTGTRIFPSPLYDWRIWWLPAFCLAAASYYFYESPIRSLGSRLIAKRRGQQAALASPISAPVRDHVATLRAVKG